MDNVDFRTYDAFDAQTKIMELELLYDSCNTDPVYIKLYLVSRKIEILVLSDNFPNLPWTKQKTWSRNNSSPITCKTSWCNWICKSLPKLLNLVEVKVRRLKNNIFRFSFYLENNVVHLCRKNFRWQVSSNCWSTCSLNCSSFSSKLGNAVTSTFIFTKCYKQ